MVEEIVENCHAIETQLVRDHRLGFVGVVGQRSSLEFEETRRRLGWGNDSDIELKHWRREFDAYRARAGIRRC
jgi:hypothetical protein